MRFNGSSMEDAPISPLATITALAGFVVLFAWFATSEPATLVIGLVLLLSGALWAGFTPPRGSEVAREGDTARGGSG